MINFLRSGGKLFHPNRIINLDYNPLTYVPYYIYAQGEKEILKFLTLFSSNEMHVPNQTSIMLIGDSMEGKSSLGRTLEKNKPRAKDMLNPENHDDEMIGDEDRTEAFEAYSCQIEDLHVYITDIGGQDDYNIVLPLLSRNHGLSLIVVSCQTLLSKGEKKV